MSAGDNYSQRRCDASCHGAKGLDCDCCCGGRYHGVANRGVGPDDRPGNLPKNVDEAEVMLGNPPPSSYLFVPRPHKKVVVET